MSTPQISTLGMESIAALLQRKSFRILVDLKIFRPSSLSTQQSTLYSQKPYKQLNFMLPASLKEPLSNFLDEVEITYASKNNQREKIKCMKLMVEDNYEVDCRFSVEECLADMMKIFIFAELTQDGKKNLNLDNNKSIINNDYSTHSNNQNGHQDNKKQKQELTKARTELIKTTVTAPQPNNDKNNSDKLVGQKRPHDKLNSSNTNQLDKELNQKLNNHLNNQKKQQKVTVTHKDSLSSLSDDLSKRNQVLKEQLESSDSSSDEDLPIAPKSSQIKKSLTQQNIKEDKKVVVEVSKQVPEALSGEKSKKQEKRREKKEMKKKLRQEKKLQQQMMDNEDRQRVKQAQDKKRQEQNQQKKVQKEQKKDEKEVKIIAKEIVNGKKQDTDNQDKTKSKLKPEIKPKFKSENESPQSSRKSSSSSDEEKSIQLQKMISASINSYSLEDAYQSAGIETPHKAAQKSSSSSLKSSTLSSPVKKEVEIRIKSKKNDKKKELPIIVVKKDSECDLDSLSSDSESDALKNKQQDTNQKSNKKSDKPQDDDEENDEFSKFLKIQDNIEKKRKASTSFHEGYAKAKAQKDKSFPNLFRD
ncbi:UNKNOWN [Stylonychia lemnae]|uniref:Uncharacterized protein n=1 Tax=Stylonychia lemnae TaxID=5949 RepID=A0A078ARV7_STYLE|nr:UNKNOWN [Stylonychia lemnae]|eukprot:CDW84909.1 UNKNOWN [Stylonychia lemnae]